MKPRIAILGGGAAGMMAAAALSESGISADIHLFEKNKMLGAKVLISGGGRCNVTTGIYKNVELLKNYPRGANFLKYTFSKFGPRKIRNRFENHGAELKEESDSRVFPVSNKGSDIVGIFEQLFSDKKVTLHFNENILSLGCNEGRGERRFTLQSALSSYAFDYVIITTGGNAYAHTGSTGDGYVFARACGHTITPLGPSLSSFLTQDTRAHELSGLSFQNASLSIQVQGKTMSTSGAFLFTHFGISGPAVFVLSAYSAFELIDAAHPLAVTIQPYSDYDTHRRTTFFLEAAKMQSHKQLQTVLSQKFPTRFVEIFLRHEHIDPQQAMNQVTKKLREDLSKKLGSGITLNIISRRPGDEFVTAGGVSTSEVNHKTMESLLCPGLCFAGEILDIDGFTGGFNLQSSRATGMIAGLSIGEEIKNKA